MANSDGPWHDESCVNYVEWVRGMARRLDTPREGVPRTKWMKGVDGLARPVEPRTSRVTFEVASGLGPDEASLVQQILRDAIGEFISVRSGRDLDEPADTLTYVNKRYPELTGIARERKIDEVMLRKTIARKLRRAVDDVEIE
jgi:hypothetical protein